MQSEMTTQWIYHWCRLCKTRRDHDRNCHVSFFSGDPAGSIPVLLWHRYLPISWFYSYRWFHSSFCPFCLVLQCCPMWYKSINLSIMPAQQPDTCQGHKQRICGCAVIFSSWGSQGYPVHVYLKQAEIPGRTCRYRLLPFQREKSGRSGLLIPPQCFWIWSQALSWVSCSACGYCFCKMWFYIQPF